MESAKKSFEIQSQIRHNAEDFKNTLNDLYSWEKQIKDKEQQLQRRPTQEEVDAEHLKAPPVRSHIGNETPVKQQTEDLAHDSMHKGRPQTSAETPTEKCDVPIDPNEEKRQQANIKKDLGNKHVKLAEFEKAIEAYTLAIDIFEDPVFFSNRALCYLKMERHDECIEDCERAIEIDNLAVKAYYRRMQANESLGNNMDALKDCTTILMIEPKNGEAKKSLERINQRLRKNAKSAPGPNFSPTLSDMVPLSPIDKPPHSRSKKPLRRVPITDVVGPKDSKNFENSNIQVSDEVIDKLFNSDCGPFVEVKRQSEISKIKKQPVSPAIKHPAVSFSEEVESINSQMAFTEANVVVDSNKICPTAKQNPTATKGEKADNLKNKPCPPAPTSTAQFYANWKELSAAQKYQYLKSIEVAKLCRILGAGFDSDTLTDVIHTLHDFYLPNKEPNLAATLLQVSKNNQVTILSLLMSPDDRKVISEILNSIKESKATTSIAVTIAKNFNLH